MIDVIITNIQDFEADNVLIAEDEENVDDEELDEDELGLDAVYNENLDVSYNLLIIIYTPGLPV